MPTSLRPSHGAGPHAEGCSSPGVFSMDPTMAHLSGYVPFDSNTCLGVIPSNEGVKTTKLLVTGEPESWEEPNDRMRPQGAQYGSIKEYG